MTAYTPHADGWAKIACCVAYHYDALNFGGNWLHLKASVKTALFTALQQPWAQHPTAVICDLRLF